MDEEISQNKGGKSNIIESLSKDELVSKYKNLIILLKKAKASKDEISAELENEKICKAKIMKSFEDEKNATEKERDALSDMVSDLSDNKLNLVTKNESLQRQLQLQLSEVESLKNVENNLLEAHKSQQLEIEKLKKFIEKQQEDLEEIKVERSEQRLKSKSWDEEKFQLLDTVQSLKDQIAQTKLLKERLNIIVEENSELKKDQEKESKEKRALKSRVKEVVDEMKALKIIQNNLNMEKKNLHENLELAKVKIEKLTENLNHKNNVENELDQTKAEKNHLDESYKKLLDKVESYKEEISSLTSLNGKLQSKLQNFVRETSPSSHYQDEAVDIINPMNECELNSVHQNLCHENTDKELNDKLNEMNQKIVDLKSENDMLNSNIKKFQDEELKRKDLNEVINSENLKLKEYNDEEHIKTKNEVISLKESMKDLETQNNLKNLENELLKQETLNIIGFVNNLLFLDIIIDSGDITEDSKNLCSSLQKLLHYLHDSNLELFFHNLSANINTLSQDIISLLKSESELTSDCLVVEPIFSILCNLKEIGLVLSKLLKFNLDPDLFTKIDLVKLQTNAWSKFVTDTFNEKLRFQKEIEKLHIQLKEIKDNEKALNENLTALEVECKNYKDALSELHQLKRLHEDSMERLNNANGELHSELENREHQILLLSKKLESFDNEKEILCNEASSEKVEMDTKLQERDNTILELEAKLSYAQNCVCKLNEKALLNEINHKKEYEDLQKLLSSKQSELNSMEENKVKIEEEMSQTIENLKSVSEELMKIKVGYVSFEDENKKTKDLVENLKLELVKGESEKCKLEEDLDNLTKLFESKQINESQIQEVEIENDKLKSNILTLESSLEELKKKLEESYLSQTSIEKEKLDIINKTIELTSEKLLAEENVETQRTEISTLNEETSALIAKNVSLENDLRQFEGTCKSLSEENHILTAQLGTFKYENNNLSSTVVNITEKLSHSGNLVEELETKLANKDSNIVELETKLANKDSKVIELEELYKGVKEKYESCLEECNQLKKLNEGMKDKLSSIEKEIEKLSNSYDEINIKLETLTNENLYLKGCEASYNEKLQEITSKNLDLIEQLNLSNTELEESKDYIASLKLKLSSVESTIEEKETKISLTGQIMDEQQELFGDTVIAGEPSESSAQRNEILADLNHMNELLRERGEKISRLEVIIQEKNKEISLVNSQLDEANKEISNREEEFVSKQEELKKLQIVLPTPPELNNLVVKLETKISTLEKEKEQLQKIALSSTDCDASAKVSHCSNLIPMDCQSEIMSTSTISKAEDVHRMKELEDSFEERYMKLKSVALKLKKKLAEQSAEMKLLEESKRRLIIEKEELLKKSNGTASRNIQVLQAEIDRLQDNVDINTKELKQRDKQLFSSAQEISDLKQKLVSIEDDNEQHSKEIKNLKEMLVCQENTCQSLRSHVASLEIKLKSEELKRIQLEEQEKNAEHRYKEISIQLEEVRQEYKKNSLLDLEMKDYEKTFEELTNQVAEKDSSILQLEQQLAIETNKGKNLIDQIQFLQSQVESETERAEKLKKTVMDYKVQLENLRQLQEGQLLDKEKDSQNIEFLNQELEKLKIAMAELSAESSKSESMLRKAKEATEQQVEDLEQNLVLYEKKNSELQQELQSLKMEFDGYKIRAQSVLRKKSTVPEENQEQTKAEREQLNAELEASHIKCHQLQSDLASVKAELVFMSSEKDRLGKQTIRMTEEMHKSDAENHEKLTSLEKKLEERTKEYQRIIANMSNQSEDMQKNFNAQDQSQKEAHLQELHKLQEKLEEAEEKIWQLKNCPSTSQGMSSSKGNGRNESEIKKSPLAFVQHHMRKHSEGAVYVTEEPLKVDVSNMIREDGEGSEWVEPSQHRSPSHPRYSPPPLEHLINNPFPPQQSLDESTSIVSAATDFSTKELSKLESKVSSCENRIIQLTNLLADSEAENEKLVQLSDMLKEEIRRGSRNESREKHLENNEYMKNVVLKFLSLKTGDEKFRLIPVLKTILQLSPEEAKQLAIIAKGDDGSGSGSQAWAGYLHLWSGR